jgi:CRISPR/Cas system CSM-associated protein Csm2 small subunit
MSQNYDVPDDYLSYSELRDRIRMECARALPKKERIILMAKKLEDDLTLKDTICDQICSDLSDVTSERHIRRCLPEEYKQHRRKVAKESTEESTDKLRTTSLNNDNNVPEQTLQVSNECYEEAFEDVDKKDVEPASEIVRDLQKKIADLTQERDRLIIENETLKEKTQPEMIKEIQERFYDEPGLIKGEKLQKVSESAGKNLKLMLERYNSVLEDAVRAGQPVPVGLYVIARPGMMLVPIRLTVDFNKKTLTVSLWEKKLT